MKLENRGDYLLAMRELERLMDEPRPFTNPGLDWTTKLAEAVEAFELEHFPLGQPVKWRCGGCGAFEEPVLNKAGDDIACAKCGAPLVAA